MYREKKCAQCLVVKLCKVSNPFHMQHTIATADIVYP